MPNLGAVDLLFLAGIAVIVVGVVILVATRGARRNSNRAAFAPMGGDFALSAFELERRLGDLLTERKKIAAIKLLRERTGLGLKEAKDLVEALERGQSIAGHPALAGFSGRYADRPQVPFGADLAARARGLKADGREGQAIHLVRGETGMGQEEAELFVRGL